MGILIVPAGGGNAFQLTTGSDRSPAWSRDGRWIAFSSTRGGQSDLWIVPAQGGEPRQITNDAAVDLNPSWSPDGELIAFASDRSGNYDLWVARVSSGALSQVTDHPASDVDPAWSPDGNRIAFASDRSGCTNIWVASDLRTISVESATWGELKQLYR
jgi:Tol biopolymer transport system component